MSRTLPQQTTHQYKTVYPEWDKQNDFLFTFIINTIKYHNETEKQV